MSDRRRLAVLGKPISHSLSPILHSAAYRMLDLPWDYERVEMTGEALPGFLSSLGPEWRGLSVTMPVKPHVIPFLDARDELVDATGACNTVLLENGRLTGFNTDVYGIVKAFTEAGVRDVKRAHVLGGGATASSAIAASAQLGASHVTVAVRSPERAAQLVPQAASLGVDVEVVNLLDPLSGTPEIVISTLPNGVELASETLDHFTQELCAASVLFDVAYDPWPTRLATSWSERGGQTISGFEMLLHQAVMQVRIFTRGTPLATLESESEIVAAMRDAVREFVPEH